MARRLTKREKVIFFICLIMVFIYGVYFLGLRVIYQKAEQTESLIEAQSRKLQKNMRLLQKTELVDEELKQWLEQYGQKQSNEQMMSSLVNTIESVANGKQLKLTDVKPQRVKTEKGVNYFVVNVTLDSSFADVIQLLAVLQQEPHQFIVDEVALEKGSSRQQDGLRVRLVLGKIFVSPNN